MASKSVLELAVGTGKWDAGLKKAKQSLDNFTQANGGLQQALDKEGQKMQQFVQMMGKMESTANTAKGKMNDYKSTIEQLTMQYNRMTDAQKQSIGQDYLNSIDSLKQKYQAVNEEIQEMNRSLNNIKTPEVNAGGGGLFGGANFDNMLAVFGGNLMTKAAGAVASLGSEMMDTVKQGVELAKAGEGVRLAFERLNKPGLLDNLKEATHGTVSELELMKAAVQFNDFKLPLEDLGTYLAFAQKKAQDTGQSVDDMVRSIVTGLGRKSVMILDNLGLSAAQIKEKMKDNGDMTKAVAEIIKEQMTEAGEYVETAATRAARAAADAQNKMVELGRSAMPVAEAFNEAWGEIRLGAMELMTTVLVPIANFLKRLREESNMTAEDIVTRGMTDVTDTVDDNGRLIRKDAVSNIPEIVVAGTNKKKGRGGGRGGTKSTPDVAGSWQKAMVKSGQGADSLKPEVQHISAFAMLTDEAKKQMLGLNDAVEDLGGSLAKVAENNLINDMNDKIQKQVEAVQKTKKAWNEAGQAIGMVGNMMGSIKDPAAQTAGAVAQAIANIAMAYSQALGEDGTIKSNIWYFIAASAAAMVSMATTISQIHSATGYAEGGIVKGNSYSGDNLYGSDFGINAGELVLNKAQQGSLAQQLQDNGGGGFTPSHVSGEQIYIALNAYTRRSGKGEIVTWR